jgi:uncharacterized damage-inducible protein DinB
MENDFANIAGMFKTNTGLVKKTMDEVDPESWFLKPGADSNHLMWVLGHLVWSRSNVLKILNQPVDIPSAPLFARGARLASPDEYPSVAEIKRAWDEVSEKLSSILGSAPVDHLAEPALSTPPSFDGKVSGNIAFLAFHETYHVGQVSYLRKWLGHGQSVG